MFTPALIALMLLAPPPQPDVEAFPGEREIVSEAQAVEWPPTEVEEPDETVTVVATKPSWAIKRRRVAEIPEGWQRFAAADGVTTQRNLDFWWRCWSETIWNYDTGDNEYEAFVRIEKVHVTLRLHSDVFALPRTSQARVDFEFGYHDLAERYYALMPELTERVLRTQLVGQTVVGFGDSEKAAKDDALSRISDVLQATYELGMYDRLYAADDAYGDITDAFQRDDITPERALEIVFVRMPFSDDEMRYVEHGSKPLLFPAKPGDAADGEADEGESSEPATQPSTAPATAPASQP